MCDEGEITKGAFVRLVLSASSLSCWGVFFRESIYKRPLIAKQVNSVPGRSRRKFSVKRRCVSHAVVERDFEIMFQGPRQEGEGMGHAGSGTEKGVKEEERKKD